MNRFKYNLKIWWLMSRNSFSMAISQKTAFWFFLSGKIIKFLFFLSFIYFLLRGTGTLAGYSLHQTIFFFISFKLVDVISQFLYREAYRFRQKIISGDFDLVLVKPVNSLFTVLMGGADVIDLVTLPPLLLSVGYVGALLNPSFVQVVLFILLILNALVIATSFYILILSFGIITFEIDNAIMMYRDLTSLGVFPADIYKEPVRGIITYIIPIGIMMTFPGKALMGLLSTSGVVASLVFGLGLFLISLKTWGLALKRYSSASS